MKTTAGELRWRADTEGVCSRDIGNSGQLRWGAGGRQLAHGQMQSQVVELGDGCVVIIRTIIRWLLWEPQALEKNNEA